MKCDEFDERVHNLLDDRASIHGDQRLLEHAETCSRCRGVLSTYDDLFGELEASETPALSSNFTQRVITEVCAGQPQPVQPVRHARRWYALAAVAIAAALLIALFPFLRSRFSPSQPNVPQIVEDNRDEQTKPTTPESPDGESSHDEAPQLAVDEGKSVPDAEQLREYVDQWTSNVPVDRFVPVHQIRGGLRPIASTLFVAIDALRSTIPIGRPDNAEEPTGHSPSAHFAPPGCISA